jgi:hypothetical protein
MSTPGTHRILADATYLLSAATFAGAKVAADR